MIALTGTSGRIGSSVLKHILTLVPASNLIVSLHNTTAIEDIKKKGVHVRLGDYQKPETLEEAFKGAEKLLIVSYPSIEVETRVQAHKNAIDAAKKVGVKHVYYTSLAFADDSVATVMQAHLQTEAYLKASGLVYTIIREGLYTESYHLYAGYFDAKETKEVVVPGDGGVTFVTIDELGEATAKIVAAGEGYENKKLLLSGAKPHTIKDLAALLSTILGREIPVKYVSEEEYVKTFEPKVGEVAKKWATTYRALERGETAVVDSSLPTILGRPLISVEQKLREILTTGAGSKPV